MERYFLIYVSSSPGGNAQASRRSDPSRLKKFRMNRAIRAEVYYSRKLAACVQLSYLELAFVILKIN